MTWFELVFILMAFCLVALVGVAVWRAVLATQDRADRRRQNRLAAQVAAQYRISEH